ncbi:MAG: hypothetical protein B7X98_02385, partial [Methylophilaceae bacterium 17-43-7]
NGVTPQAAVLRTQMEGGPPRYRKRFSDVPEDVTANFVVTAEQMAIFRSFYRTDINMGADWFVMNGLDIGNGYETNSEVHMVGQPNAMKINAVTWKVSLKLEVRNA